MSRTLPLLGKLHPLTGQPIRAIGFRPNGEPLWPILGGDPSNDPPERPEDVPEEEWDALGDPGKQALVRVRQERDAARTAEADLKRQLAAARAKPAPPKSDDKHKADQQGGEIDIAAIVQQAVEAAVKPFTEREEQREAEEAAGKVQEAVLSAAETILHDKTDALTGIDLVAVVDDQGHADPAKIKSALDDLVKRKPHLAKSTTRLAPPGIGGGAPAGATDAEKVKAVLADMQKATGVRVATAN